MIYNIKPGQVSYGEAIGILLLESYAPFIPGDVANATTYSFPVRFQRVPGLTVERIFNHDLTLLDQVIEAACELKESGVMAITGDCGFMAIYQNSLAEQVDLPVFMSSLLQIPFMSRIIGSKDKIGIVTANAEALTKEVLRPCGALMPGRTAVVGLENKPHFKAAFIEERGELDAAKVEAEVVSVAEELIRKEPKIKLLLLECSVLPPYGAAIAQATRLPVFDFVTMIDYVFNAVVKRRFTGFY